MKQRKYKEDYGFESYIDERGHEKRKTVYHGCWYRYHDPDAARKAMYALVGCLALCVVCYVGYMLLGSPSSTCMYVLPVAACALFTLVYWVMGMFSMWRAPQKMTRVQTENGVGRVVRSAAGCAALLGMASGGDMIFMIVVLKENFAQELLAFALLACAAAAAVAAFRFAKAQHGRMLSDRS